VLRHEDVSDDGEAELAWQAGESDGRFDDMTLDDVDRAGV